MKTSKLLKALVAMGMAAVFAVGMVACSGGSQSKGEAVAATVNGVTIPESEITNTIEAVRAQQGLDTEEAWGTFLVSNNMTPESVREQILDSLIDQELMKQGAADLGVSVDSAEVDSAVDSMKVNFGSDEAWAEALKQAGFTEESYRETVTNSLLQQAVQTYFTDNAEPTEEDLLESANNYASYYDGSKRSSHILFDAADEETAKSVLESIQSGSLDFADAAKQHSKDSSAENGGDVGWDRATTFVTEYQTALDNLELNQVSDLVTSQYGIHIIKCTDVFVAPDEVTSLDQIPEAFQEMIKSMASSLKASSDYQAWIEELRESADIVINDMPADVPYNIDLTKYEEAASASADAATETTAESASAESTSAESEASEGSSTESASSESASASAESASAESASAESSSAQ